MVTVRCEGGIGKVEMVRHKMRGSNNDEYILAVVGLAMPADVRMGSIQELSCACEPSHQAAVTPKRGHLGDGVCVWHKLEKSTERWKLSAVTLTYYWY